MSSNTESISPTAGKPSSGPKSRTSESGSTTQRMAGKAHEAVDSAAKRAEEVESRVREQADRASEKLGESREAVSSQIEQSISQLEAYIRERPLSAAGMAFAAGALASILLRR